MCMYAHAISPAQGVLLIESVLVLFLYIHISDVVVSSGRKSEGSLPLVLINMAVVFSGHLDPINYILCG